MAGSQEPILKLRITPEFVNHPDPYLRSLHILLAIESPQVSRGNAVIAGVLNSTALEPLELQATDDNGFLPVALESSSEAVGTKWVTDRDTSGDVKISYTVNPTLNYKPAYEETSFYPDASRKGLLGSGLSFVHIPQGNKTYRNLVEWDLSNAPKGTRAVWTFGEGPEPVGKVGPASILNDSVYMVGKIQSNPTLPSNVADHYGYYWFGDLPPNINVSKDIHHKFFLNASEFFDDPPSQNNPYRSFVRNNGKNKVMGGTSFKRSHIFDYDNQISQATDYDLVRHLSHELVHNWLGPSITENKIDWLFEGINNALSVYFPFRFKFRTPHYFMSTINMLLTKYYTSPLINLIHAELLKLVPIDFYARQLLGARAWVFVVGTDVGARDLSDMKRPVEDLAMKPLAKKKANGDPHGIEEFLVLLQPLMGDKARDIYEEMTKGSVILLPPEKFFGPKTHRLMPIDQEVLDFGMDIESFGKEVVKGLKSGGRADEAGLMEGDVIISSSHLQPCVDNFELEMEVIIHRDGEDKTVRYWPRSFEKAKSWSFMKLDEM